MPGMTMAGGAGPRPTGVMPMQGQGQPQLGMPQQLPMGASQGMAPGMMPMQGPVMGMGMGAPGYSLGMGQMPMNNGGPPATSQQIPLFPGAPPGMTSMPHQNQWANGGSGPPQRDESQRNGMDARNRPMGSGGPQGQGQPPQQQQNWQGAQGGQGGGGYGNSMMQAWLANRGVPGGWQGGQGGQ